MNGAAQGERYAQTAKALESIPAVYSRVLISHLMLELSVKQIIRCNRIPVGTALSRIFTAKKLLRPAWEG